ncbi:MAG: hypothetical protein HZA52_04545 [Planctomycetes bacterium]|nr:hypothetical protein [Planctomycetota bacterium]
MPTELLKCPNCFALLSAADTAGCPYCGATFAPTTALDSRASGPRSAASTGERLARLAEQADVREVLRSELVVEPARQERGRTVALGGVIVVFLLVVTTRLALDRSLLALLPLLIAAWTIRRVLRTLSDRRDPPRTPIKRFVAALVGKRTELVGASPTRTAYFLTLEYADGEHDEHEVDGAMFGLFAEGDLGLAYLQGPELVRLRRFELRER